MINFVSTDDGLEENKEDFYARDMSLPIDSMNVADIVLRTRYPKNGYVKNTESDMIVRIIDGEVSFYCEGEEVLLSKGAVVLVEKGKSYCWVPNGFVRLYIVSNPPWTPEQAVSISAI